MFCQRNCYKPQIKTPKKFYWGNQLLPKLTRRKKKKTNNKTTTNNKKTNQQTKLEQEAKLLYQLWQKNNPEVVAVAEKFIFANCYNPDHVKEFLRNYY